METKFKKSNKLSKEIWYCFKCPLMCKSVCTTHSHTRKEQHSLHARVTMQELVRRGLKKVDNGLAENQYHCTLCRLCREWCATKQNFREIQKAFRTDLVELDLVPKNVLEIEHKLDTTKNPFGELPENRFQPQSSEMKEVEIAIFMGCKVSYKSRMQKLAKTIKEIFDTANVRYVFLEDEWCCGGLAADLGLERIAKEEAEHNVKIITDSGAKTLVTLCPRCAYSFKFDYPEWNLNLGIPVLHYTEFLNQLMREKKIKLKNPLSEKVTYHDPCVLGRGLEVYEAPRDMLKEVPKLELVEMKWNKEKSLCCGAGAGYSLTYPKIASEIGYKTVAEAQQTGADTLVVACPGCELNYAQPVKESGKIRLTNIAEIIKDAIVKKL